MSHKNNELGDESFNAVNGYSLHKVKFFYTTKKGKERFWVEYCPVPSISSIVVRGTSAFKVTDVDYFDNADYLKGVTEYGVGVHVVLLDFVGRIHSIHAVWF